MRHSTKQGDLCLAAAFMAMLTTMMIMMLWNAEYCAADHHHSEMISKSTGLINCTGSDSIQEYCFVREDEKVGFDYHEFLMDSQAGSKSVVETSSRIASQLNFRAVYKATYSFRPVTNCGRGSGPKCSPRPNLNVINLYCARSLYRRECYRRR